MENLKLWAVSLCGALVVSSIFRIIIKNSSLYKTINIFLSMFIFLYTIIPLENIFNDFEFINFDKKYEQSYDDYYKDGYEKIIIQAIKNICKEDNVDIMYIEINSYVDEESNLIIRNIDIKTAAPELNDILKKKINDKLGFEVTIIWIYLISLKMW